jgi:signal transduction histidine kinase
VHHSRIRNSGSIFHTDPKGPVICDVNDIQHIEHALNARSLEGACADQMKSEFLATMSHELRTPLTAISGFSEALLLGLIGNVSDKQKEYIQDIYDSAQHLLGSITDILDQSKIDAGLLQLQFETSDLNDILLASVLDAVRHPSQPRIDLDSGTAPFLAQLDVRNTKKIIDHMLSNAVKFSAPNGHVRIQVSRVPRNAVGTLTGKAPMYNFPLTASAFTEFLQLTVHDNGIGISEQNLPNVFRLFNQIDSGLERQFEGAGLGASLVKSLAELHGGTVAIASEEGVGTSFAVWLPLRAEGLPAQGNRTLAAHRPHD